MVKVVEVVVVIVMVLLLLVPACNPSQDAEAGEQSGTRHQALQQTGG